MHKYEFSDAAKYLFEGSMELYACLLSGLNAYLSQIIST